MKIVETAIISQKPQYLEELTQSFPLEKEIVLDIEVYRFEIDENLVILLYDLNNKEKVSDAILEHLSRHLAGFLVIADTEVTQFPPKTSALIDNIANRLTAKPTVVAVRTDGNKHRALNDTIADSGFFLSEKGRVLFWTPEKESTIRQVWRMIWNTLQTPA